MIPEFTKPPPVSIIINNYNYGRFVREAIESALNQNHPAAEVIVVDDGSTDNSRAVIESYGDRIKAVFKANGGQASAFNAGLPQAGGEIIMFLDSDDFLLPEALGRIVDRWKAGIGRCNFRLHKVDQAGHLIGEIPKANVPLPAGNLVEWQFLRQRPEGVPTSGNAFPRAVLEKIFPVNERFRICADAWIFYRSAFCGDVLAIEEVLGAYRVHGANNYAGEVSTDAQALKMLASKLASIHAKIDAALTMAGGSGSPVSLAGKVLDLWALRQLNFARCLGIAGPVTEFDRQFTFWRLYALLLAECGRKGESFSDRLRCLAEAGLIPFLPKSITVRWDRSCFHVIRCRLREKFGLGRTNLGAP